ncbi:MAG TPA: sigma 54-interacting transcriptional regulator [Acidobacteriaceae bacterium]
MSRTREMERAPFEQAPASTRWMLGQMVGRSPAMERLFLQMRYLANHLRVALIEGESGTGKLLTAETLHGLAAGRASSFVPCQASAFLRGNCSALLDEARGGTLFLTHVDALTPEDQARLLQLLEWHQHQHTRNNAEHAPRQILVSSRHSLRGLVLQGQMRADLSYHLTSVRLQLPALRERREDLGLLADHFVEQFSKLHGKPLRGLGPGVLSHLLAHSWPGNVRELQTTIHSGALMCEGQWIRMIDLPLLSAEPVEGPARFPAARAAAQGPVLEDPDDPNLDRAILRHIRHVLAGVGGNKLRAARMLGISRSTLYRLLEAEGLHMVR